MKKVIKRSFSGLSIQSKQALVIIFSAAICVLFTCTTFFLSNWIFNRKSFERETTVLMELISINSITPLYFEDPESATEILGSLKAVNDIVTVAAIYKADGTLFATYTREKERLLNGKHLFPKTPWKIKINSDNGKHMVQAIAFKNNIIGYLYILNDLTRYNSFLLWSATLAIIVNLVSILIAVFMSNYLKRLVLAPILHLARTVKKITVEKNFSIRAKSFYSDEIGELIQGFNEMIAKIQRRDNKLENHRRTLEKTVEERTSDIVNVNEKLTMVNLNDC